MKWKEWEKEHKDLATVFRQLGDLVEAKEHEDFAAEAHRHRTGRPRKLVNKAKAELILWAWRRIADHQAWVLREAYDLLVFGEPAEANNLLEVITGKRDTSNFPDLIRSVHEIKMPALRRYWTERVNAQRTQERLSKAVIFTPRKGFQAATEFQALA